MKETMVRFKKSGSMYVYGNYIAVKYDDRWYVAHVDPQTKSFTWVADFPHLRDARFWLSEKVNQ